LYGEALLSRVMDANDITLLKKHGITRDDLPTEAEREVYDAIIEYANTNGGKAPGFALITADHPEFTYVADDGTATDYMAKRIKDAAGKRLLADLLNSPALAEQFEKSSSENFAEFLTEQIQQVKMRTSVREKVGTSLKNDHDVFKSEYERRKEGKSFKIWKSRFPRITKEVGGYVSGNCYAWYGRSGRGKSVIVTEEAIEAAIQGATVLFWSMEMPKYEVLARMYTSLSAREGFITEKINGIEEAVGFLNSELRMATLTDEFKIALDAFLDMLPDILKGDIILRAVDDDDFNSRKIKDLERDIELTNADVVVIDPIYYMDFEANTSKTAGGDVAATSKRLRRLTGTMNVVTHVITQADETSDENGEEGRELRAPTRKELSKSKAILQDAALTIGIDTLDGQGLIQLNKGRDGGEGTQIELTYLPNYGIVRELEMGDAVTNQFTTIF
jgi:replicative DNA helicase